MSNLLLLTKINLLSIFTSKDAKKKSRGQLLLLVAYGYIVFMMYTLSKMMLEGYIALNVPHLILAQFMLMTTLMIMFTNIYKVGGTLFNFKDYDLLMSLPIKRSTVIISKIIMLYMMSFIFTILFMIPAFIAYVTAIDVSVIFYIKFFVTLFVIPIVPLVISSIIGTIITGISSRFNKKNIVNYIVTIAFFIGIMYVSFSMENTSVIDMANIGKSMVSAFNSVYPLTNTYISILTTNDIIPFFIFLVVPGVLFYLFILVINKFYIKINNNLISYKKKSNYKLTNSVKDAPLIALYKKEIKRYFSSVNYVMNTAMGALMLTLSIVGIVILGGDKIESMLEIPGFQVAISNIAPLVVGAFCMLNCSTHSSISLEGKNLWIIKSLPVSIKEVFLSKIMVNLTILIPTILINSTIFNIYLKPSLLIVILMYVTPIIYALLISILGIVINVHFPIFDFKNEIKVIKQSLSSFLALFLGMIIAIVPFVIKYTMTPVNYVLLITSVMLIIMLILYYYMNTRCVKLFNKLY